MTPAARRVLTAATMDAHNTFVHPTAVSPVDFDDFVYHQATMTVQIPAQSVVALTCTC
jgi:alpha-L-arabinofuranosidase